VEVARCGRVAHNVLEAKAAADQLKVFTAGVFTAMENTPDYESA
jgi:hypothetical protein